VSEERLEGLSIRKKQEARLSVALPDDAELLGKAPLKK
jgi:hypothetical protein